MSGGLGPERESGRGSRESLLVPVWWMAGSEADAEAEAGGGWGLTTMDMRLSPGILAKAIQSHSGWLCPVCGEEPFDITNPIRSYSGTPQAPFWNPYEKPSGTVQDPQENPSNTVQESLTGGDCGFSRL